MSLVCIFFELSRNTSFH